MSEPDAVPLPRGGEVFFDVRGEARSMRLSWYADSAVAVFSIWQGNRCTGTFRLPFGELARMVEVLQSGASPDGAHPRDSRPEATAHGAATSFGAGPARQRQPDRALDHAAYDRTTFDSPAYPGPRHDRTGYDGPGPDSPGYDRPGYDGPGYDRPGYDSPGYDSPGYDRPGHDRPDYDGPGYDSPGYDSPGYDRPGRDSAGYDGPAFRGDQSYPDYDPPNYGDAPRRPAVDDRRTSIHTGAFSHSAAPGYAGGATYPRSHSRAADSSYDNLAPIERRRAPAFSPPPSAQWRQPAARIESEPGPWPALEPLEPAEPSDEPDVLGFPSVPARNGPSGTDWGAATASYPAP